MTKRGGLESAALLILVASGCGAESSQGTSHVFDADAPTTRGAMVHPDEVPPGLWEISPGSAWSLQPDLRIGAVEGDGPYVFGHVRNLIPDGGGGVWVFDQMALELRHFDAEGRHVASAGRKGDGPGEFSGNACAWPGPGGEIWVETELNWHRFDGTGELLGTFRIPDMTACAVRTWLPDGRYLAGDVEGDWRRGVMRTHFIVLDWSQGVMTPTDTVDVPALPPVASVNFVRASGRVRSTEPIPFVHNPKWLLEQEGLLWAWDGGGAYDIRLQTLDGDTLRRINRPYAPVRIDGRVRREAIGRLHRPGWQTEPEVDESQVPDVYPPFSTVRLAADGSAWVRREVGEDRFAWDVFSDDDRYLGVLQVPEALQGISIRDIGPDHVWGILRDDMDVQYVVRARIVRPNRRKGA